MILLDFDKEEYMNWPKEDEDVGDSIVASVNDAAQQGRQPRRKLVKMQAKILLSTSNVLFLFCFVRTCKERFLFIFLIELHSLFSARLHETYYFVRLYPFSLSNCSYT